ncbi:hypothetical protein QR721_13215 [Aciduricibacillus chroicocephali]|uniref:DUF4352 domain-containing protein n=1 Tax=Aciduricibacillus chroicocephali TaxID=3054939 RepID=A0ABY9KUR4_9BACI|nr:hypothetical protein QR721_13215 [Bacillaceae bacterium 44XB]
MKKLFGALIFVTTILLVTGCSNGKTEENKRDDSEVKQEAKAEESGKTRGTLKEEDYKKLPENFKKYANYTAELSGKITDINVGKGQALIMLNYDYTDPSSEAMVEVKTDKLKEGDYVQIKGTIVDEYTDEDGEKQSVDELAIKASSTKKVDFKEAFAPTKREIKLDQKEDHKGLKVSLQKLEIADEQTRLYLTVNNESKVEVDSKLDFSKMTVGGKELELSKHRDHMELPEFQAELKPGEKSEGVLVFPAIEQSVTTAKFEVNPGRYNFDIQFDPFEFTVNLK